MDGTTTHGTHTTHSGSDERFGSARLHGDAIAVAFSSIGNAALGVVFWAVAARLVPPHQLGVMTAVLSVITSLASVVAAGVGDAYTALLPATGSGRTQVYRRGQRLFLVLSVIAGVLGAAVAVSLLREIRGSVAVGVLIAAGVVAWGAFTLQNSTMVAIGRARWVPLANLGAGLGKIALLVVFVLTVSWHAVELSAVIAVLAVALVLRPILGRLITSGDRLPEAGSVSVHESIPEFNRVVRQTISLSSLGLGLLTLTPFLVTVFAGPGQGALFALCLTIVATFDFIGASMAVSLVVHASGVPEESDAMARAILRRAATITLAGTVVAIAVVPPALQILNPAYPWQQSLPVIVVLCLGTLTRVPYLVWTAIQQARRNLRMPLVFNAFTAVLMLALLPVLCHGFGALGGAVALLVHQLALSVAAAAHHVITTRAHTRQEETT